MTRPALKAVAFDVFGTVVDWRTSVIRECELFLPRVGRADIDPAAFADYWRNRYIDVMRNFLASGRDYVSLDVLHREMLEEALAEWDVDPRSLDEALLANWNLAWHRLDPWPDSSEGITQLKARYPVVTMTNGNIALMMALARRGGLPFDALLGAEVTHAYKPDPRAYTATAEVLGIEPAELCLVASHHSDLGAARAAGLVTAYVDRPMEYGGRIAPDANAVQDWEWSSNTITGLAEQIGR